MLLFPLILFILGLFIGSFLGVLIDRLPQNKSILGRSQCDYCNKPLSPIELIPILSFVFQRGKCRSCHRRTSYFYPFVELITGLLFVIVFIYIAGDSQYQISNIKYQIDLIYYLLVTSGLIAIFFADLKYRIIPDQILFFLTVVSLPYLIFSGANLPLHILSAVLGLGILLILNIITKGRGMGLGDVKFAAVLGLVLGIPGIILALYLSFLTGAVASIILILWGKKKLRGGTISFGPFMALGAFLTLFFSSTLIPVILPFLIP